MTEAKEFLQVLFQHLQNGNADGADSDEDYDCDRPVRTAWKNTYLKNNVVYIF